MSPDQRDRREFVELKLVNQKVTNMNYYRLIIIDTVGGRNNGPEVVLIANLHNEKFKNKFWVIGSENIVPKPDKPFSGAGKYLLA